MEDCNRKLKIPRFSVSDYKDKLRLVGGRRLLPEEAAIL